MKKVIYVVTTLKSLEPLKQDPRSPGWYSSKEDAITAVEHNDGDIYECGHYPYCIIEGMAEGLYGYFNDITWFKWEGTEEEGGYKRIENPLPNLCGFGIG